MSAPSCIWNVGAKLAEGPVWHAADNAFYFVDIKGQRLHRVNEDGSGQQSSDAPGEIGFALPVQGGGFVCGLPGQLMQFTPELGFRPMLALETAIPGNRLNDGGVDVQGRLWFGSMDNAEEAPTGALYRLDKRGLVQIDSGYVITNGPCTSPDGKTFYHTDTLSKTVYAFDKSETGSLSNKRVFTRIEGSGYPDGSTVDSEGNVWIALFCGSRIERYTPSGELSATIPMPCPNITKIAFGGQDLRTVFVTTAWKGLTDAERAQYPLAGGVFTFRVDVPGLPQPLFDRNAV
ncbi:SMP-30/gluconolactonase/LRE family protein [Pseudoduganella sp. RAF53_2]|uniref:SMP-30/gluconolactonase/LRE family protein n=1 Tax=unclassified Pseudoduganella TaxID=2637179 RepID=UPI003F9562E3